MAYHLDAYEKRTFPYEKMTLVVTAQNVTGFRSSSMMCAGPGDKRNDACFGDSGGPLLYYRDFGGKKEPFQVGIVSFGHAARCGFRKFPTVYTRVSAIGPWIRSLTVHGKV